VIKRLLAVFVILTAFVSIGETAHRAWGKTGTATTTNATLTAPFNPAAICVSNTGATNNLFFDYVDGVATTADDSNNILVTPGATICHGWSDPNVSNTFTIGLIASAATTTYAINATQR